MVVANITQTVVTEWGIGVNYKFTSTIKMELAYDAVDYGSYRHTAKPEKVYGDNNLIIFRTTINF